MSRSSERGEEEILRSLCSLRMTQSEGLRMTGSEGLAMTSERLLKNVVACLWQTGPIYWAIVPDESGNYENFGGESSRKCLKLNEKSKLNSLNQEIGG